MICKPYGNGWGVWRDASSMNYMIPTVWRKTKEDAIKAFKRYVGRNNFTEENLDYPL